MKTLASAVALMISTTLVFGSLQRGESEAPAGRIVGVVSEPGGMPLDRVSVTLLTGDITGGRGRGGRGGRGPTVDSQSTITDAAGQFSFARLASGTYTLRLERAGYGPVGSLTPILNATVVVGSGNGTPLKFSLLPWGVVAGRVRRADGSPAGDLNVQVLQFSYSEGRRSMLSLNRGFTNVVSAISFFF